MVVEPIIEKERELNLEQFSPEVVDEYRKDPQGFAQKYDFPARHYSQLMVELTGDKLQLLLKRLSIKPQPNEIVTIFGGYTGQFAEGLRDAGFPVIFTDPIEEYVKRAKTKGFEAYCHAAEELPSELIGRTHFFASFECYFPFQNEKTSIYTVLRFLQAPEGIIFAESKRTLDELKKEGGRGQMKAAFKPFADNYSIKRTFRENDQIKLYQFKRGDLENDEISLDCRIMKLLYDLPISQLDNGIAVCKINERLVDNIAQRIGLGSEVVRNSIERVSSIYKASFSKTMQNYIPAGMFWMFSKRFECKF